jgi:deoxyribonuclease-2
MFDSSSRSSESRNFIFSPLTDQRTHHALEIQQTTIKSTRKSEKTNKKKISIIIIISLVIVCVCLLLSSFLVGSPVNLTSSSSSSVASAPLSSPSFVHSCLDSSGSSVDYWIILKSNRDVSSVNLLHKQGYFYSYLDSKVIHSQRFQTQTNGIFSPSSPLIRTINQIYKGNTSQTPSFGSFMYNDDIPGSTSSSSSWGHTKGIVSFSPLGGFWLIHSHPNFPVHPNSSLPSNTSESDIYGQSSICLSVDRLQLNKIAQQLQVLNPQVYALLFPVNLTDPIIDLPWSILLNSVADSSGNYSRVSPPAVYQKIQLQTLRKNPIQQAINIRTRFQSIEFQSFAKNAAWAADLYGDFLSPSLGVPLFAETWMRPFESSLYNGTNREVRNVKTVNLTNQINWNQAQDHSKWTISQSSAVPVACVGDMNKAASQANRAGGTLCLQDIRLWNAFRNILTPYTDAEEALK